MKLTELQGKTVDELKQTLYDLKKEAMNLRFQQATGELENTARIRTVRKSVARVNTLLNEIRDGKAPTPAPTKPAKKKTETKEAAPKKTAAKKPAAKKKAA